MARPSRTGALGSSHVGEVRPVGPTVNQAAQREVVDPAIREGVRTIFVIFRE
jgi:hypothetical protein